MTSKHFEKINALNYYIIPDEDWTGITPLQDALEPLGFEPCEVPQLTEALPAVLFAQKTIKPRHSHHTAKLWALCRAGHYSGTSLDFVFKVYNSDGQEVDKAPDSLVKSLEHHCAILDAYLAKLAPITL